MSWEIILVLGIVIAAVILFTTEKLSVDVVAGLIMVSLMLSGIVTPKEGVSGFSNSATITIAAMFVLSAGLFRTGAVNFAGEVLAQWSGKSYWLGLTGLMVFIGSISAFINNTAAVAIFLPIVIKAAQDVKMSPSKFLMPMSFASIFGGVCTLIGTSTNILVSSILVEHNKAPFQMFEFTALGGIFFVTGIAYMLLVGVRLLPERKKEKALTESFELDNYLADVVVLPDSESVGKSVKDSPLVKALDIDILSIKREGQRTYLPEQEVMLKPYDVLRVRADIDKIKAIQQTEGVSLRPDKPIEDRHIKSEDTTLVEAVIAPNSELDGRTLAHAKFKDSAGITVLAIRQRGKEELLRENIRTTTLRGGDTLLIDLKREQLKRLKEDPSFNVISEHALSVYRKQKIIPAVAIIAGVVATAAFGVFPIMISAVAGAVLMILTRCLKPKEAYKAIEWKVIFLLAGVLPLGIALEKSGAAGLLADTLVDIAGQWGPRAILAAMFMLTTLLTSIMSNQATVILLAPIAIGIAESLGLNARPFLVGVTFAGSLSLITPVGYQTNMMIYGPGEYKFSDFFKVGTPLNLLFLLLATFLIPLIWPF